MDAERSMKRARSFVYAGGLLIGWSIFMVGIELFILGADLPASQKIRRDPMFLAAAGAGLFIGMGVMWTGLAALRGQSIARTARLTMGIAVAYGWAAFLVFLIALVRRNNLLEIVPAGTFALLVVVIWNWACIRAYGYAKNLWNEKEI